MVDIVYRLLHNSYFYIMLIIADMAGAMMIERAQSIPAMESIDPKEYLAK